MTESKLREALQGIVDAYEARSELYTSDAECAQVLADKARKTLSPPTNDTPDKYCVTAPDGDCVSTDPRCMHQPTSDEGTPTETPVEEACRRKTTREIYTQLRENVLRQTDGAPSPIRELMKLSLVETDAADRLEELEGDLAEAKRTLHAKERELADAIHDIERLVATNSELATELATLQSVSAAPPSGYVQVPVEPTQDWLDSVANRLGIGDAEMRELHSALLAATPTPSDSKPGDVG